MEEKETVTPAPAVSAAPQEAKKHIDPTALGLFGLALVTLVASMQKFGVFAESMSVLPWAVFLGSLAQLAAAVYDYKKGNAFGGLAFMAYGLFWAGMALSWYLKIEALAYVFVFAGYLIFTLIMTAGALKTNLVLFIIFVLIDVLFLFLTVSSALPHDTLGYTVTKFIAAGAELGIAIMSFYGCAANILGIVYGKKILPIGRALIR